MYKVKFDDSCVESSVLSPTYQFVLSVAALLRHGRGAPGFVAISGLPEVFRRKSLSVFSGIRVDGTPDSTSYLASLLRMVYANHGVPEVTTKYVTFNGYGNIRSNDDSTLRYGAFSSREKYYCSSRIGIERVIIGLIEIARRENITLSRESFFESARVETGYESTKVPHLDPYPGIGALQKHVVDIEGGDSEIYDVGRFCNERKLKPWDVLMLHSPNPQYVFGDAVEIPFVPYNAFIPRPEYVEELKGEYRVAVIDDPGQVVLFNNTISCDDEGLYYCIAHGASTPKANGAAPCRELSLSIAFPSVSLKEVRRLLALVRG